MEYQRELNLQELLEKKSFFLLGPRATGKTYLIKQQLNTSVCYINLLQSQIYLKLSESPSELEQIIDASKKNLVVIDEIQKLPILLDEVHRLIEERKFKFLLTGSSARKLKSGKVNLLGGRAWQASLFPLVSKEIKNFKLDKYLNFGGLPIVYQSEYPLEDLDAYIANYLLEEIQSEGAVRDLLKFSRFLKLAAIVSGDIINFSKIASDVGRSPSTVIEYFKVLEDTLLGFMLEPWAQAKKRKEITSAKFYFFDIGVRNILAGYEQISENTEYYGKLLEHFIALELKAYLSYRRSRAKLAFYRTYDRKEVDFIIGNNFAIEVKAAKKVRSTDYKNLQTLRAEEAVENLYLISRDKIERLVDGIHLIPYDLFLKKLWNDEFEF